MPACIAGSVIAANVYDLPLSQQSDIDVFCYSDHAVIAATQKLLNTGFQLDERFSKVWARWLRWGFKSWHTNSIKLFDPTSGMEVNLVYKLLGGHPVTSLSMVLESFDFGLLGAGYDLLQQKQLDMRSYLFPDYDLDGPLPLMPNKREAWRNGFISQYNGIREMGRYAKYSAYGHDLSMVKDDLVEGYQNAVVYLRDRDDPAKRQLGDIYQAIAFHIEDDKIDEMLAASKKILSMDALDEIMEALE